MANPFDQFDGATVAPNPFDQFDEKANPFDRFDTPVQADARMKSFFENKTPPAQASGDRQFLDKSDPNALSPFVGESLSLADPTEHGMTKDQFEAAYNDPLITLPKPANRGPISGVVRGLESTVEGLTSPVNIGLLATIAGAPKVIQSAASIAFRATMIKSGVDKISEALEPGKTPGERAEALVQGGGMVAMGGHPELRIREPGNFQTAEPSQEMLDRAATQDQLRKLAPETAQEIDPKPKGSPEILDGLQIARRKLVDNFNDHPPEVQKARQTAIDQIDEALLAHDKDAVNESAARTAQPEPPTGQQEPPTKTEAPASPPAEPNAFQKLRQEAAEKARDANSPLVAKALESSPPPPEKKDLTNASSGSEGVGVTPEPVFSREEIQVSKPQVSRRKRPTGTDGESVTTVEAPSKISSPENWHRLGDINKVSAHVHARINFETGKVPKKSDPVWTAYGGRPTARNTEVLKRGVTYDEAVEAAKDYVHSANPTEPPETPSPPPQVEHAPAPAAEERTVADEKAGAAEVEQPTRQSPMDQLKALNEDLTKGGGQVEKENAQENEKEEVASEPAVVQPNEQVSTPRPGEKLADDLRKLGRVNRDPAQSAARELSYYSDEERQQLQEHLGTEDANPDTLARAITGKAKLKEVSRPSEYVDEPGGKEGRGHPSDFGEDYVGGPGAMGPREAEALKSAQTSTGLKKATVLTERLARGEEPLPAAERQSETEAVGRAMETQDRDPAAPRNLVSRILDKGDTAITRDEAALLLVERNRVTEDMRQADARLDNTEASELERTEAKENLKDLENQIDRLDRAQREAGSQWGRVGRMYQQMIREDYSLEGIQRKMRTAKGGPLTEAERTESARLAEATQKAIDTQEKATAARAEDQAKEDVKATYEKTIADLKSELAKAPKISKPVLDIAQKIVDRWKGEADEARKSLRARLSRTSAGVDPTIVLDVAKIMRAHVGEIGLDLAKVTARVLEDFGDEVKPYLKDAWKKARDLIDKEGGPAAAREAAKKGLPAKEKTPTDIAAKAKAEATAGEELSNQTVYELARAHIKAGVHGEDAVMAAVHKDIKEAYPSATERDVRRAFSDYGKTKFPSQEAVAKELRELRTLTRLQESIDRLKEGQDALKTGPQRDKASQEIREKQKQLDELLKTRQGPPSPEKLASREEAKVNALNNRIADIDKELKTGERPPESATLPDSPAVEQLKAERDAMQEKLDEVRDSQKPKPPEADAAAEKAQQAVDRAAAALDRQQRINAGEIKPEPKEKVQPLTALEKELRDRTEELKQAKRDADEAKRKADAMKTPEEIAADKAQKGVDAAAAALDRWDQILKGELSPDAKTPKEPLSNLEEEMRSQVEAMKQAAADIRRDQRPKTPPEEAQLKALEKSIAEYERRVREMDFSPKPEKSGPPDTKKIADAKAARDAAKSAYEELKKAQKPKPTLEESYNKRRMTEITKQVADLEDRLKTGNLEKEKPVPLKKTAEVAAAEAKLTAVRREVDKAIEKKKYDQLSPQQKFFKEAVSTLHSITAIKIGGHGAVGMITHAGGLIFRPTRATIYWKNFGRQFAMWQNKAYHEQLIYRLKNDPEFETWKKAGASIDPDKIYTDYGMYAQWLGRLAEKGARGFDALKLTRLELNKADWKGVPDEIKDDPKQADAARKLIAEINNKATGTAPKTSPVGKTIEEGFYGAAKNPIIEAAFFAPRLYASRWGRVLFDPVKTVRTLMDPASSPVERFAANKKLKNAAEFTGTLLGALLTNQAILSATGSKQNVNLTDPKKSDWLKFKAGDKTITADGGLLDPVRLVGQVMWKDLLAERTKSEQYREGTRFKMAADTVANYLRGKLSPPVGLATDVATGSDFQGRPLPWSKDKPQFKDQTPYTYGEWLLDQGPIPMEGAAKEVAAEVKKQGFKDHEVQVILRAAMAFGLGMAGVHVGDDYSNKPKPSEGFNVKVKKR